MVYIRYKIFNEELFFRDEYIIFPNKRTISNKYY